MYIACVYINMLTGNINLIQHHFILIGSDDLEIVDMSQCYYDACWPGHVESR